MDFESEKYQTEFQKWKADAIVRLDRVIERLEMREGNEEDVVMGDSGHGT